MTDHIAYREATEPSPATAELRDAVALRFDPSRRVMLRFQLSLSDVQEIEALRYARRAMIRDERLRGLEWDEPSMEDPTLTGSEIRWFVLASQAAWCREKMTELVRLANRALGEIQSPDS